MNIFQLQQALESLDDAAISTITPHDRMVVQTSADNIDRLLRKYGVFMGRPKYMRAEAEKMTPFKAASLDETEVKQHIEDFVKNWTENNGGVRALCPEATTPEEARTHVTKTFAAISGEERIWLNNRYQVNIRDVPAYGDGWPKLLHLSIKRLDKEPIHDWRDLQQIKNELVGDECEGVELYPAESRRVDTSNQYHVWVFAEAKARWPFGFSNRCVISEPTGNAKQRPL